MFKSTRFHLLSCIVITSLSLHSCNNKEPNTGDTRPAQENQLRALVQQYPDSLLLKENLVQYFRDKGNYDKAISETEIALQEDSLNARLYDIKATLYFENGDTANAINAFEKAISINRRPGYIISLGSLYAQTRNPKSLDIANSLLQEASPESKKQGLFIKGLYFSYTGEKVKAIMIFNNCILADYRFMLAYREKAICLYDLNKYATALDVLIKAVEIQNTFDEAYYWMGRCYEKLGKKKEAIDSYQLALQFDPLYVEAGDALTRLGKGN